MTSSHPDPPQVGGEVVEAVVVEEEDTTREVRRLESTLSIAMK